MSIYNRPPVYWLGHVHEGPRIASQQMLLGANNFPVTVEHFKLTGQTLVHMHMPKETKRFPTHDKAIAYCDRLARL